MDRRELLIRWQDQKRSQHKSFDTTDAMLRFIDLAQMLGAVVEAWYSCTAAGWVWTGN